MACRLCLRYNALTPLDLADATRHIPPHPGCFFLLLLILSESLPYARHNLNLTAFNLAILPLYLSLLPSSCSLSPRVCLSSTLSLPLWWVFYLAAHLFTLPRSQSRVSPVIISLYSPFSPYRRHSSRRWNYMRFRWVPPRSPPPTTTPPRGGEEEEEEEDRFGEGREGEQAGLGKDKSSVSQVGDCKAWLGWPASPYSGPDPHLRCNYFVSQLPLSPIDFASVPFHTPPLLRII